MFVCLLLANYQSETRHVVECVRQVCQQSFDHLEALELHVSNMIQYIVSKGEKDINCCVFATLHTARVCLRTVLSRQEV